MLDGVIHSQEWKEALCAAQQALLPSKRCRKGQIRHCSASCYYPAGDLRHAESVPLARRKSA
ncbi:MAG: hypothetical protein AAF330_07510, partial [Pseudomonadota bacterium]